MYVSIPPHVHCQISCVLLTHRGISNCVFYSSTRDFVQKVIRFVSIHRFFNTLQFSFSKLSDVPHIPPPVGDTYFQLPNMFSAALVHIMKHMYSKHILTPTAGFFVLCWFSIPPHIHCQTSCVLLTNGDISSCVLYSPTRAFPQTLIRFVSIQSFFNTFQFSFSRLFDVPHVLSLVTHTSTFLMRAVQFVYTFCKACTYLVYAHKLL